VKGVMGIGDLRRRSGERCAVHWRFAVLALVKGVMGIESRRLSMPITPFTRASTAGARRQANNLPIRKKESTLETFNGARPDGIETGLHMD